MRARARLENRALADARLSADHLRADVAARTGPSTPIGPLVIIPFADGTKRAFLRERGLSLDTVRRDVSDLLNEESM